MVAWHPQLNGNKFEQTPGDSEGQGSLGCCSPWGRTGLSNRSGSKDLKKLNPLYKFKQFIYDVGTGTLVCAFKHNKIILSHWRNLNSSRSVTWHPGTQHAMVPLMKGLAETANIKNHSNNKINSFQ